MSLSFAAIDFETADARRDSACAVGLVKVREGVVVDTIYALIRPPRSRFSPFCVQVHGIEWSDVQACPTFREFWIENAGFLEDVEFLAAHNAGFDRSVLGACCRMADLPAPRLPYVCTVELARNQWNVRPTKLPDVCRYLGVNLTHHHAASDALACARIVLAALAENPACLTPFGV